jgi:monoamine oxidase
VIVGAGLSGLAAAHRLEAEGHSGVVVLEAQDEIGGRIKQFVRPNGRVLMTGGEFTGTVQSELADLARELAIDMESLHVDGKSVRVFDGRRYLEEFPLQADPGAAQALDVVMADLAELVRDVSAHEPWTASRAREWDRISIAQWVDGKALPDAARRLLELEFAFMGDPEETSFLYLLWFLSKFGSAERLHGIDSRFVGGSAQIPLALAERIAAPVHTSRPVRRVLQDGGRVTVEYDGGSILSDSAILAMEPGQAAMIEFHPRLPLARDRLQDRWLALHGGKYFAIYDSPFWRDDGLSGAGFGQSPAEMVLDTSPADGDEGILCATCFESGRTAERLSDVLSDPARAREVVLDALVSYFGEHARDPKEFYGFQWAGDRWSQGCGTQLPLGVLTTVGPALREPVGSIVWAGADTGDQDWMEGAVTAGRRAAHEALQRAT